jgi:hypothetical protein
MSGGVTMYSNLKVYFKIQRGDAQEFRRRLSVERMLIEVRKDYALPEKLPYRQY